MRLQYSCLSDMISMLISRASALSGIMEPKFQHGPQRNIRSWQTSATIRCPDNWTYTDAVEATCRACSSWTHLCKFSQIQRTRSLRPVRRRPEASSYISDLRTKLCLCKGPPSTLTSRRCLLDQNQGRKNCNMTGNGSSSLIQESSTACAGISIEACPTNKLKLLIAHVSSGRWSTWHRSLAWTGARTSSSFSCILYLMAGTSSPVKTATTSCIGPKKSAPKIYSRDRWPLRCQLHRPSVLKREHLNCCYAQKRLLRRHTSCSGVMSRPSIAEAKTNSCCVDSKEQHHRRTHAVTPRRVVVVVFPQGHRYTLSILACSRSI